MVQQKIYSKQFRDPIRVQYFHDVFRLLSSVFNSEDRNVARLNELSISKVFSYLGIEQKILFASELEYDRTIDRADRLIHLSKMQGCQHYINSPGGKDLYRKDYFDNQV